jgi:hypothetical protein
MTASVLYIIVKMNKNKNTGQTGKASTKYFKKFPRMYYATKIKIYCVQEDKKICGR